MAVEVHSLVCLRDLDLACRCLPTVLRCSTDPITLVLHDDGSLTEEATARLLSVLPGARVISRGDADRQMAERLIRHPYAARFRRTHPFALKLLDTTLLTTESVLRYCDTDIVCFRRHDDLFALAAGVDATFMADTHDAYAWRSWQVLRHRVRLVERSNAGLMLMRVSRFDLDRVEWILRRPFDPSLVHFAEQTVWAILAAPLVVQQWDPAQVRIVAEGVPRPTTLVAGHYIGPFRHLLDQLSDADVAPLSAPAVSVRRREALTLGGWRLAGREAGRLLRRQLRIQPPPGQDAYAVEPRRPSTNSELGR